MRFSELLIASFAVCSATAASVSARDAGMDMHMDSDMGPDMGSDMDHGMGMHDDSDADAYELSTPVAASAVSSVTTQTANAEVTPVAHEVKHMHGMPILQSHLTPAERLYWENYNTTTFFTTDEGNRTAFWLHVMTLLAAAVVLYPICIALNNIDSGWYLPMLSVYNIVMITSLVSLSIFDASFPETWYAKNAYRPMSYILFVMTVVHFFSALIVKTAKWIKIHGNELDRGFELNDYAEATRFSPLHDFSDSNSVDDQSDHDRRENSSNNKKLSFDPRDSLGSPTTTLFDTHGKPNDDIRASKYRDDSNSFDIGEEELSKDLDLEQRLLESEGFEMNSRSKTSIKRDTYLAKVFGSKLLQNAATNFSRVFSFFFHATNYPILLYFFVYVPTGLAVGSLIGQGNRVFNLLAHWIKGGVFLSLGVLSLARYCGFGANKGWAWNKIIIFKNQVDANSLFFKLMPQGGITMECIESFLIAFYGCTNVFLEHLSNPNGKWAAKDLQHVSIAFMYIGCGFCGLLAEINLSSWRFNHVLKHTNIDPNVIHSGFPGYSPNPFPTFTIFWTGILMSQHAQASQTSTQIHVQWGYLLSYGSFFRLFTFILLKLVPNKNLNPSKPFTELITSFCLICGGLVFMESTDQVVEAMEYRGFTPMFTFNLSVGVVTIFMAWEMLIFMWKDWLKERKNKR